MTVKELIELGLKERSPDHSTEFREIWYQRGKGAEIEPERATVASQNEAMYFAGYEAELAVGLLTGLGNAPSRTALGALREGIRSRLYSAYCKRVSP